MSKDRSGKNNAIIIIRCDLFPFLFFSFFVVASRPRSRHARKFAKDRSMVRPGNGSFTGKPTVFTRFWLGIHREFWKIPGRRRAPTIRSNAIVGIHSRPALKSALSAGKIRCSSSPSPRVFSTVLLFFSFSSSPRRGFFTRKQITIPLPPPPSPFSFFSFFLLFSFLFFFYTVFFFSFVVSFRFPLPVI